MSNPLQGAHFLLAAHRLHQLPADRGAEVAFAGRSNAGKSSALNALTGQKSLARTSKTPGRTQQMVAFGLPPNWGADKSPQEARLIDLPGYGYAEVPLNLREHWKAEIDRYLKERQSLKGVVLIADIRHPLKEFDQRMLGFCAEMSLPCHLLLTKADKLSRNQALQTVTSTRKQLAAAGMPADMQIFSALSKSGVAEARAAVVALLCGTAQRVMREATGAPRAH